jgi:hypothetical protein
MSRQLPGGRAVPDVTVDGHAPSIPVRVPEQVSTHVHRIGALDVVHFDPLCRWLRGEHGRALHQRPIMGDTACA